MTTGRRRSIVGAFVVTPAFNVHQHVDEPTPRAAGNPHAGPSSRILRVPACAGLPRGCSAMAARILVHWPFGVGCVAGGRRGGRMLHLACPPVFPLRSLLLLLPGSLAHWWKQRECGETACQPSLEDAKGCREGRRAVPTPVKQRASAMRRRGAPYQPAGKEEGLEWSSDSTC